MTDNLIRTAVDLDGDGAHPAAWRESDRTPGAVLTPSALRSTVVAAEAAGFTLATFEDAPVAPSGPDGLGVAGRIEAGTRAAFVSTATERIGLAPTLHVATTEPFHLATQLASLDHASRGRAGWVVGAANDAASRATIGAAVLAPDALRQEVIDVIQTARRLWDSWQDDAVIKDVGTGRYLDPDRVHHIDFVGSSFTVKGPLITPRPPQGQVVVIAPDVLEVDGSADVVLLTSADPDTIRDRAVRARDSGVARVLLDVEVLLDAPGDPATVRAGRLDEHAPWEGTGRLRHVGSSAALVSLLRDLAPAVDGFRFLPAVLGTDLPLLAVEVLPGLRVDGVPPVATGSLRAALGLARPANRYAVA